MNRIIKIECSTNWSKEYLFRVIWNSTHFPFLPSLHEIGRVDAKTSSKIDLWEKQCAYIFCKDGSDVADYLIVSACWDSFRGDA